MDDVSTLAAFGISVIPKPDARALLSGIADSHPSGRFQGQRQGEHASLSREIVRPD